MTRRLGLAVLLSTLLFGLVAAAPAHASRIYALTAEQPPRALGFDSAVPQTIISSATITGISSDESTLGWDVRPADGELYLLTRDSASTARLYTVEPLSGSAVLAATLAADPADTTAPYAGLPATAYGLDFDPFADVLRVVNDFDQNLHVNPDTGAVTTDTDLHYGATADPSAVVGLAYTNSFAGSTGAELYGIDLAYPDFVTFAGSPTGGSLLGFSHMMGTPAGPALVGFDFAPRGTTFVSYAQNVSSGPWQLFTYNVSSGNVQTQANIGTGLVRIRDIAVMENPVQLSPSSLGVDETSGHATVTVTRGSPDRSATVDYGTVDGSATAGSDYAPTTGSVTFAPSETSKSIEVPITNDSGVEGPETFGLVLTSARGEFTTASLLPPSAATVTIADDDRAPAPPGGTVDRTRPGVKVAGVPKRMRRKAFLKGLRVRVTVDEPATLELTLDAKARRVVLARAAAFNLTLAHASRRLGTGTRRIKLKPARKLVGKARRFRARVKVVATDAAGNRRTVTRTLRVVR
jgi:Domain of unknown function (DUF4394)/Calx-beta domain